MSFTTKIFEEAEPETSSILFSLALRLAKNYKYLEIAEFKAFMKESTKVFSKLLAKNQESGNFASTILDAFISVGQSDIAFKLMDGLDHSNMQKGSILGIYLDLLADQDIEKASKI